MLTLITVPTDLVAQISPTASGVFVDLLPIAYVAIGIALGVWFVAWAIAIFRRWHSRDDVF